MIETWTIKPGNIASACHVIASNGAQYDYAYLSKGKQPAAWPMTEQVMPFANLPSSVRLCVEWHFERVFTVPIEQRGDYLAHCVPIVCPLPCPFCNSIQGDDDGDQARCRNCGAA